MIKPKEMKEIKKQIEDITKYDMPRDVVLSYMVDYPNLNYALSLLQSKENISILSVYQDRQSGAYTMAYYMIIFKIHKNEDKGGD